MNKPEDGTSADLPDYLTKRFNPKIKKTKFHTKVRPGDLVRDIKTGDEGIIVRAEAIWIDNNNDKFYQDCADHKMPDTTYIEGTYSIYSTTRIGSLDGSWFYDNQIELVKKGHLWK